MKTFQKRLRVESEDAAVRDQLPKPIKGLKSHFKSNKALDDTESHPFKEVELRHAGRTSEAGIGSGAGTRRR